MLTRALMIGTLFSVLSSCGVSLDVGGNKVVDGGGGTKDSTTLNGKTPEDAYGDFLYKVIGTCADKDKLSFRYLKFRGPFGMGPIALGTETSTGRRINADLEVFLKPGGVGDAHYREYEVRDCGTGCTIEVSVRMDRWFRADWRIDGAVLAIDGIGRGSYLTINETPTISLKLIDGFVSRTAAGASVAGQASRSNVGDDGISINQYCGQ